MLLVPQKARRPEDYPMNAALFFGILATTVVGPWLFVFLFGPAPIEQSESSVTQIQYWLLGSVVLGIGGIGAWLGFDRQRDIAEQHHTAWAAAVRPVVVI